LLDAKSADDLLLKAILDEVSWSLTALGFKNRNKLFF